jgi:hypothetical protein
VGVVEKITQPEELKNASSYLADLIQRIRTSSHNVLGSITKIEC